MCPVITWPCAGTRGTAAVGGARRAPLPRRIVITYRREDGRPQFWRSLASGTWRRRPPTPCLPLPHPRGQRRSPFLHARSCSLAQRNEKRAITMRTKRWIHWTAWSGLILMGMLPPRGRSPAGWGAGWWRRGWPGWGRWWWVFPKQLCQQRKLRWWWWWWLGGGGGSGGVGFSQSGAASSGNWQSQQASRQSRVSQRSRQLRHAVDAREPAGQPAGQPPVDEFE